MRHGTLPIAIRSFGRVNAAGIWRYDDPDQITDLIEGKVEAVKLTGSIIHASTPGNPEYDMTMIVRRGEPVRARDGTGLQRYWFVETRQGAGEQIVFTGARYADRDHGLLVGVDIAAIRIKSDGTTSQPRRQRLPHRVFVPGDANFAAPEGSIPCRQ